MGYNRGGLGGIDFVKLARGVADIAGQVQSGAQLVAGGAPAVSFATRYKWPIVITSSAVLGGLAMYALTQQRKRR